MYNKVILIGNVGKDPDCRAINEQPCCTFSLATSESYKDKNGEWQNLTEWHNIVTWRKTAEYCEKYLKKGMQVLVEGKIKSRSWQDKDSGKTMYATDIVVESVKILDKKDKAADGESIDEQGDLPF